MASNKLPRQTCSIHIWEGKDGAAQVFVNFDPPLESLDDPKRVPNEVEALVSRMLAAAREFKPELVI